MSHQASRQAPDTARTAVRLLAAVAVVAGATVATTPLFAGGRALLVLLGAVVAGAAPAGATSLLRPGADRLLAILAGLAGVTTYVVLVLAPGSAVVDGPRRLLTGALPMDPAGPELSAVALVVGGAAAVTVTIAARARTPVALLPGLAAYALALWVAAAAPAAPKTALLLVVAGCLGLLAAHAPRTNRSRATASVGPRLAGAGASAQTSRLWGASAMAAPAAAIAAVTAVTLLMHPQLPGSTLREPADARTLVAEPVRVQAATSPLVLYPALRSGPDRPLLVVRTAGSSGPGRTRLRWVTLERFDGTTWTTAAAYQRAGRSLPPGPVLQAGADVTVARVELRDASLAPWLPTVGRATKVSQAGLGVDPNAGDLVVPVGGEVPVRYTVTGATARLDPALLRGAVAAPAPQSVGAQGYDVPPGLQDATQQATAGARTAFGRLAGLESFFRRDGRFTLAAPDAPADPPAGHGLFQVSRLLADRNGTAEQYASAFAVMARSMGYDARVVVGFRAGRDSSVGGYVASSRSVHAWPEVRFEDLGWISFEPTPAREGEGGADEEAGGDPAVERAVAEEQAARSGGTAPPPPPTPQAEVEASHWPDTLRRSAAGLVTLAVLGLLAVPATKAARRFRRRARGSTRDAVLAAWDEAADRLVERGVPASRTMSRPEVVAAASSRMPDVPGLVPPLDELARLADSAGFGPGVEPASAAVAWQRARAVSVTLRGRDRLPARVRAAIDPRPLTPR